MIKCICSDEWILSYDVRADYIAEQVLPHSAECEIELLKGLRQTRDMQILERWKWITASENCGHPYSHGPHGNCSGRSFDRT